MTPSSGSTSRRDRNRHLRAGGCSDAATQFLCCGERRSSCFGVNANGKCARHKNGSRRNGIGRRALDAAATSTLAPSKTNFFFLYSGHTSSNESAIYLQAIYSRKCFWALCVARKCRSVQCEAKRFAFISASEPGERTYDTAQTPDLDSRDGKRPRSRDRRP